MNIGAHVSTAGGVLNAINKGKDIGAEALQIFPSSPQRWQITGWPDEDCVKFKDEWPKHFKNVVFHSIYLNNLAGTEEIRTKSIKAATDSMILAEKLGISQLIIHTGTYLSDKKIDEALLAKGINEILSKTPKTTKLVFENSASATIGGKLEDLRTLMSLADDKTRVGVCLDTCHAYAAGFDIKSHVGYEKFMKEIENIIKVQNVLSWHLNDSKFELGAKRDRHENIGEGFLGKEFFGFIINDKRWDNTAGYLETPGFDNSGPDKNNINILKQLRHS